MGKTIGLIDVDSKKPNLALMKLSAAHKALGDCVEWYDPLFSRCEVVYASKIFSYTPDYPHMPAGTIKGGPGYTRTERDLTTGPHTTHFAHTCPDYGLYGIAYSVGYLTRGCPNRCAWCIVPREEGRIRADADLDEFVRHERVVLLDNNVLAHPHGISQIQKMSAMRLKVDFTQGLDAKLIDRPMAELLAGLRWWKPLKLACDTQAGKQPLQKAVEILRRANVTPKRYGVQMIVWPDIDEALDRAEFLRALNLDPFAQAFRPMGSSAEPTRAQRDFARWVNHKATFKKVKWSAYTG
jgi:hypothetical protein